MSTSPCTPGALHNPLGHSAQPSEGLHPSLGFCSELDVMKRDRFELLSAYLDGEVTPEERTLVQTWLSSDPTVKCLYDRLLAIRCGLRQPVSTSSCDAEVTLAGVFHCLNRRFRMVSMAGVGVVAIGILNLLSEGIRSNYGPWHLAQQTHSGTLQIALDQPAFPIPELPGAVPASTAAATEPSILPVDSQL